MNDTKIIIERDPESGVTTGIWALDGTTRVMLPTTAITFAQEANQPGAVALSFHGHRVKFIEGRS